MKPANTEIFKIEVMWQVTWRVLILTSTFTFPNKALLYHTDDTTGLSGKTLSLRKNVCDSEGVFPLTNTYATQVI